MIAYHMEKYWMYLVLYLHHQNLPILHHDVTANNVLLTSDMKPKITDFCMSCVFEHESGKDYIKLSTGPDTK